MKQPAPTCRDLQRAIEGPDSPEYAVRSSTIADCLRDGTEPVWLAQLQAIVGPEHLLRDIASRWGVLP